jgi:hypothetical protein
MNARLWKLLVITMLSIMALQFLWVEKGHAATTDAVDGYKSRPCGFDNDKDGDYGESGECDYCDGSVGDPDGDANGDPDGDGVDEDMIYVDCNSGCNTGSESGCGGSPGAGTPGDPYRSVEYALGLTDGTSFGTAEEDIICVRATCGTYNGGLTSGSIAMSITQDGKASVATRNANVGPDTGNAEQFNYEYPDDPFMIVAWDTDNDEQYPPYDTDQSEPFIIDGCSVSGQFDTCESAAGNTLFSLGGADHFELAHLTIANVGVVPASPQSTSLSSRYAIQWGGSVNPDHQRIHDIRIYRQNANNGAYGRSLDRYLGIPHFKIV